jgi:CDP-diacylglycerol--serine O-phosphatidyltransferase
MLFERGDIMLYREHVLLISVAMSLLLISPIRMFALKFKGFGWRGNELRYIFILVSVAIIILKPAYSMPAIIVLYIAVSTLRWLFGKRAEELK